MVRQDATTGNHPVGLAVVHRDPVGVKLRHALGATRVEGGGLLLRHLLHQTLELAGARLVSAGFLGEAKHPHRLQDAQSAQGIGIGGVFRRLVAAGPRSGSSRTRADYPVKAGSRRHCYAPQRQGREQGSSTSLSNKNLAQLAADPQLQTPDLQRHQRDGEREEAIYANSA